VIAAEGSQIAGELVATPLAEGPIDDAAREAAWRRQRTAIMTTLRHRPVDLVHLHGIDFAHYLPPPGIPCLVTLHLPLSWYDAAALRPDRPLTWLSGVSHSQYRGSTAGRGLLPPIANGVAVGELAAARHAKRGFALVVSRICPEKGIDLALEAARRAGLPLLVGGRVFPYADHLRYFRERVAPLLGGGRRFLGPLGFARKRRLMAAARCVVLPSLAPETSSLVAMEALACGTSVVAFDRGALPEIVEHGRTGLIVRDVEGLARAMREVQRIDPERCRETARRRFRAEDMAARYLRRYRRLVRAARTAAGAEAAA
jgi:glycosyltransferase involved in cell wall biosynthesis